MVHINYKWNISKINGKIIILNNIEDILLEKNNNSIEYNELIYLLNIRTKNIIFKRNKKKKNIMNFIKNNFISLQLFIKNESNFLFINNIIYLNKKENEFNDWILIE